MLHTTHPATQHRSSSESIQMPRCMCCMCHRGCYCTPAATDPPHLAHGQASQTRRPHIFQRLPFPPEAVGCSTAPCPLILGIAAVPNTSQPSTTFCSTASEGAWPFHAILSHALLATPTVLESCVLCRHMHVIHAHIRCPAIRGTWQRRGMHAGTSLSCSCRP